MPTLVVDVDAITFLACGCPLRCGHLGDELGDLGEGLLLASYWMGERRLWALPWRRAKRQWLVAAARTALAVGDLSLDDSNSVQPKMQRAA